jgi:CDP-glycerol glycerophosphotransferase (TagB/SpsB family)
VTGETHRARLAMAGMRTLNRLVPKRRRVIVHTIPDLDDTAEQLIRTAARHGIPATVLVEHVPAPRARERFPAGTRFVPMRSVRGVWAYLRACFVIFTHSLYYSTPSPRNQVAVNVWHGMPIKRISAAANEWFVPAFDFTIATSQIFVPILARSFNVPPDDVLVTGLPRNDTLFATAAADPPFVVYLPTWRPEAAAGRPGLLTPEDLDRLDQALAGLGVTAVVKPHPLADQAGMNAWRRQHITVLHDCDLSASGRTLYRLLAGASLLITDYSSVAIDFLLTGRPVILFQPDAGAYRSLRGFNPGLDHWSTLGHAAESVEGVLYLLKVLLGTHADPGARLDGRHHFHDVLEPTAAETIVREMRARLPGELEPRRTIELHELHELHEFDQLTEPVPDL